MKRKKAFSLIELLISLIIISLIVSAFMPILSKKLKHREITYSAVKQIKTDCTDYDTEQETCLLCDEKECNFCSSSINVPEGYYVDSKISCDIKKCPDGCAKCNNSGCFSCFLGYGYDSSAKTCTQCKAGTYSNGQKEVCTSCPDGTISDAGANQCSACSVSEHKKANAAKTACENVYCSKGQYIDGITCKTCPDNTYQSSDNHQRTSCLTCNDAFLISNKQCLKIDNFNAGDAGGLTIPSTVDIIEAVYSSSGSGTQTAPACWQGTTSTACDSENGGYDGCTRTVCNFSAAKAICEHHGWRLPTDNETKTLFVNRSVNKGTAGLQLCNSDSGYLSAQCNYAKNCPGAYINRCYAQFIWTNSVNYCFGISGDASGFYIGPGNSFAASVRCVKDL